MQCFTHCLIVFIPTLGSSGKNTNIWSVKFTQSSVMCMYVNDTSVNQAPFTHVWTNFCMDKDKDMGLHQSSRAGKSFEQVKCASLGPSLFRSQTCTLSCSKICPVPMLSCKCKAEPCKFLSVQKFVWTCVNGAYSVSLCGVHITYMHTYKSFILYTQYK